MLKSWKLKGLLALVLIAGIIAALGWSGVVSWPKTLSKIPLLGDTVFSGVSHQNETAANLDSIKAENKKLRDQVDQLRQEANLNLNNQGNSNNGNQQQGQGNNAQQGQGNNAQQGQGNNAQQGQGTPGTTAINKQTYRKLADYYASMKPAQAVAILKNQDPQTVAGILHAMDSDAAGAILSAMDPAGAARTLNDIATLDGAEQSNQTNSDPTGIGGGTSANIPGGGF